MCVIIAGLGTAHPTAKQLETGCRNNPDGFGWGVVYIDDDDYYAIKHNTDMDSSRAIAQYLETMSGLGERVVASAFHARIATHGSTSLDNCHPFKVGHDERTLLFHNGILDIAAQNGRSDSRILAEDILPVMGGVAALDNDVVLDMLSEWAAGSKLVILSIDPAVELPIIIVNESDGYWDGDLWFSNNSCKSLYAYTRSVVVSSPLDSVEVAWDDAESDWVECQTCQAIVPDRWGVCDQCWACLDCGLTSASCRCYAHASTAWDLEAF